MNIYEVRVSRTVGFSPSETWLFTADSLEVAVQKAQKKIKRSPRYYENYVVSRAEVVSGTFIN